MKAKRVYEIVGFQRKKDTKLSLNLGESRWIYPPFKEEDLISGREYLGRVDYPVSYYHKRWIKIKPDFEKKELWTGEDYSVDIEDALESDMEVESTEIEEFLNSYIGKVRLITPELKYKIKFGENILESLGFKKTGSTKRALEIGEEGKWKKIWREQLEYYRSEKPLNHPNPSGWEDWVGERAWESMSQEISYYLREKKGIWIATAGGGSRTRNDGKSFYTIFEFSLKDIDNPNSIYTFNLWIKNLDKVWVETNGWLDQKIKDKTYEKGVIFNQSKTLGSMEDPYGVIKELETWVIELKKILNIKI